MLKASKIIGNKEYERIVCTVSGGSDSDIVIDICNRYDKDKKIEYVWFDTGLEYKETKKHLKYLEEKYGIKIKTEKAIKPIPVSCKEYGQPFLSKQVSEWIERLQRHNFKWEDKQLDVLLKEYPSCKAALRWWCNNWGHGSRFNINYNKYLKNYMIESPPQFKISPKCCKFSKKDILHDLISSNKYDLNISGIRKSEGGARSTAYKNCFDEKVGDCDNYRPIFFYLDETKKVYEAYYNIIHSNCYEIYGLKRTGCAGCPYGQDFEYELDVMKQYEPNLYKAVNNIFRESYDYTRKYREYAKCKKSELKDNKTEVAYKQIELDLVI